MDGWLSTGFSYFLYHHRIFAWLDVTHLVCPLFMFSLHLCQEATSHHLHPSVPLPALRTSPAVWTLPGFIDGVWSPQLLGSVRAAAVVCGLWAGGGVPGLETGTVRRVETEVDDRWDQVLGIPWLWFRRWAPDCHFWWGRLLWDCRCCCRRCRGGGSTTRCWGCLTLLWFIWFVRFIRLIRFGGSLDEIQKSSFTLFLFSILRFWTL